MAVICPRCHHELQIGDFPFCKGSPADHLQPKLVVVDDGIPGGILIHNAICHPDGSPKRYDSKSEIRKACEAQGWAPMVRHVGTAGSDKNPHTTRWI